MFENSEEKLIPRDEFIRRLLGSFILTLLIASGSLTIGSAGYHHWGGLDWIDSFYNASMILAGMGPVDSLTTDGGKLFASFYALYSGIAFVSMAAVIVAPIMHRFLHSFHLSAEGD